MTKRLVAAREKFADIVTWSFESGVFYPVWLMSVVAVFTLCIFQTSTTQAASAARFKNPQAVERAVWTRPEAVNEAIDKTLSQLSRAYKVNAFEIFEGHLTKALAPKTRQQKEQKVEEIVQQIPQQELEQIYQDVQRRVQEK